MQGTAQFPGTMVTMGRRNNARRNGARRQETRRLPLGSHWRADGAPKAVFGSQQDALRAANVRRIESGVSLQAYECDFCSSWHLAGLGPRED
jgi:hypothetical protein